MAYPHDETVSQAARRLLMESLRHRREPGQEEIDAAIATLEALRKRRGNQRVRDENP